MRQKLLREIKTMLAPHLWESGYRKAVDPKKGILGGSRPLLVWVPKDKNGKIVERDWILDGFAIDTFQGFTEEGVITDDHCGGLVTTYWRSVPVEDLTRLRAWIMNHLPKIIA